MHYTQLASGQRYQIEALLKLKTPKNKIADIIGVYPLTISRELKRNTGLRGYRPKQAQSKSDKSRQQATKALKLTMTVIHVVDDKLQQDWSQNKSQVG